MVASLHNLLGEARKDGNQSACDLRATFAFLGIDLDRVNLQEVLKRQRGGIDEGKVVSLIEARKAARKAKNFTEADRIRGELKGMGIELEDKKDGTTHWRIER